MAFDRPSIRFTRPLTVDLQPSRFSRAKELAAQIDDLLGAATAEELEATGYAVRLAQGLTRSLIDQLDELHRGPSSSRRIPVVAQAATPSAESASIRNRRAV